MLPSDFFRRNVVLSFQEDAVGIRLRVVIGVDNMVWGSDYPHSESTSPPSRDAADRPCLKSQPTPPWCALRFGLYKTCDNGFFDDPRRRSRRKWKNSGPGVL
jgi:hypothetical protein